MQLKTAPQNMHVWRWQKERNNPKNAFKVLGHTLIATKPYIASMRHAHEGYSEIFWIEEGSGIHYINGVAEKLMPGDILFVRTSDVHSLEGTMLLKYINIMIANERLESLKKLYFSKSSKWFWITGKLPYKQTISKRILEQLRAMAEELWTNPRESFYIDRFLLNLLFLLKEDSKFQFAHDMPEWLKHACTAMLEETNLQKGLSAFYSLCARSPEHASRQLKLFLGKSPTEFINEIRCNHAARKLEMTALSVQEVAFECGYENLSHFYTKFKQLHGMSPLHYRQTKKHLLMEAETAE